MAQKMYTKETFTRLFKNTEIKVNREYQANREKVSGKLIKSNENNRRNQKYKQKCTSQHGAARALPMLFGTLLLTLL